MHLGRNRSGEIKVPMMNVAVSPSATGCDSPAADIGWSARLDLMFRHDGTRTVLQRNRHHGPLRVQRPFYPEGGVCHVYLLHPPGGVVAGDTLSIAALCGAESRVLLTTPSAGRIYQSNRRRLAQAQDVHLEVERGARCEWLPQETIVFNDAEARNDLRVDLAAGAHFTGWEVTCLGRTAGARPFVSGRLRQRWSIYRGGQPLLLERNEFAGGEAQLSEYWGLGGATALGTLVSTFAGGDIGERLRDCIDEVCSMAGQQVPADDCTRPATVYNQAPGSVCGTDMPLYRAPLVAVTELPELVVVRALGDSAASIKNIFFRLWSLLRLAQDERDPAAPRIWFT